MERYTVAFMKHTHQKNQSHETKIMAVLQKHTWCDASGMAGGFLSVPACDSRGKATLAWSGLPLSYNLQDLTKAD